MSCSNNHTVSPWGGTGPPPLSLYAEPADLEGHRARLDEEIRSLGLVQSFETTIEAAGEPILLLAYSGTDSLGRPISATRAVSGYGVVLAVGPLDSADLERGATELLPAAVVYVIGDVQRSVATGKDLVGNGQPDVVLRAEDGGLELWRIGPRGAVAYPVDLDLKPTKLLAFGSDEPVALFGAAKPPADAHTLRPELSAIATFDGTGFSQATESAIQFHEDEARARTALISAATNAQARVEARLERAWHRARAGQELEDLDELTVAPSLQAELDAWRSVVRKARAAKTP